MASSVGDLIARFSSTGFQSVSSQIDQIASKGNKAEKATDGLTNSLKQMAGTAISIAGVTAGINALVETNRSFEKLRAGLVTATGSTKNMEIAWASLMQYAMDTPYGIEQVVSSFTKLVNYGLTPSEEALTSFGDTASAMSKSLDQMVEAVADAITGEFERLKEFGIRASKEGDNVSFTFRGVTTTVKNSSAEIERYLIDLGKTNFGGGMARQMATLDGSIANLSDTWEQFKYNLSDGTFADVASGSINKVTNAIQTMNDTMESGEQAKNLESWSIAWSGWSRDIDVIIGDVTKWWEDMFEDMDTTTTNGFEDINNTISHFPANIRAYLQVAIAYFDDFIERAKIAGQAVAAYMNPFNSTSDVTAQLNKDQAARAKNTDAVIASIWKEADATNKASDEAAQHALAARIAYEEERNAAKAAHEDQLKQFKVGGGGGTTTGGKSGGKSTKDSAAEKAKREAEQAAKERARQYQQLVLDLQTEQEAIQHSYQERVRIIKENTAAGSAVQTDMMARAAKERDQAESERRAQALAQVEQIRLDLMTEEEALLESYEKRRKIILENTELTEQQRGDLMTGLTQRYTEQQDALMAAQMESMASYMSSSLGTITQAIADAGAQSNFIYKAMFAAQKAMAIPSMIVSTEEGATKALALGPVAGPIAAMAIRTLGYAAIGTVAGQSIAGLFDQGGLIPSGKSGIVGEYGPELVQGPAIVTSRKATMDKINGSGGGYQVVRPVVNQVFHLNGTGMGDSQLRAMLRQAAQQGGEIGYSNVLADVTSRGNISRKIGR